MPQEVEPARFVSMSISAAVSGVGKVSVSQRGIELSLSLSFCRFPFLVYLSGASTTHALEDREKEQRGQTHDDKRMEGHNVVCCDY